MSLIKISERFVLNKLKKISQGNLKLINYDGKVFHFGDLESKLSSDIKINKPNFYLNVIMGGSSALGEAHMKKDFYSSNLTNLIELTARNINTIYSFSGSLKLQKIKNFLKKIFASNTKSKSKKYISKHYDLGNEFFSLWLDKSLTYSSAVYKNEKDDLEIAQRNKFQELINLMNIKDGNKVLEIGCGWGGFAEIAAKEYKCNVVGITLSNEQAKFAQRRMQENQLSNLVDIRIEDYRDVQGSFDKIVSIEMFEAVGEEHWRNYFETIKTRLKPGGLAGIQSITIANEFFETYKRRPDFIQKYIFPGGILPSEDKLNNAVSSAGLKILDDYYFGKSYAETLRRWQSTFEQKWDDIKNLGFDEKFQKMWRYYLSYCEAGFESGHINVGQFLIGSK